VTQARDQNNKHDKLALATFGKIAYAICLEKTTHSMCYFGLAGEPINFYNKAPVNQLVGLASFVVGNRLRNTFLPVY
jgi:hypothetical protein